MNLTTADWERLREMRQGFLDSEANPGTWAARDYWSSAHDLELYEATFAQRISWKWKAVLRELAARNFPAQPAVVLDWGCGTGAASRAWLEQFGGVGLERLHVWDRAAQASTFARGRLAELLPAAEVRTDLPEACDLLLVSHVLGETGETERLELAQACARARSIVWVEPGSRVISRALIARREELCLQFDVLAPCPQRGTCGLVGTEREEDWCHHFTGAPRSIFQDPFWGHFSRELGIDLRSLSYSFLALVAKGAPELPEDLVRILGRPRIEKGRARLDVCDRTGVATRDLLERIDRARFRELGDAPERARLYRLAESAGRIQALDPWP